MKHALKTLAALVLAAFAFASNANAQCDVRAASNRMSGMWHVESTGGEELRGWFAGVDGEVAGDVFVLFGNGAINIGESGTLPLGNYLDANRTGGFWCSFGPSQSESVRGNSFGVTSSFTVAAYPARLSYTSDGLLILEIGAANKATLFRH
jgi:hypothetical protein